MAFDRLLRSQIEAYLVEANSNQGETAVNQNLFYALFIATNRLFNTDLQILASQVRTRGRHVLNPVNSFIFGYERSNSGWFSATLEVPKDPQFALFNGYQVDLKEYCLSLDNGLNRVAFTKTVSGLLIANCLTQPSHRNSDILICEPESLSRMFTDSSISPIPVPAVWIVSTLRMGILGDLATALEAAPVLR
jgi:hypothetical protein